MLKLTFKQIWFKPFWYNVKSNILDYIPGKNIYNLSNLCYWIKVKNKFILTHINLLNCCDIYYTMMKTKNTDYIWQSVSLYKLSDKFRYSLDKCDDIEILMLLKNKLMEFLKYSNSYNLQESNKIKIDIKSIYDVLNDIDLFEFIMDIEDD